uniref:Uncharacterized protein n=1 Tax=Alexandrium andersonii TaxID=327968 RepID=A0A7S2B0Z0_9DINO
MNLLFAPYFQYKVWERLMQETDAESLLETQGKVDVEKEQVLGAFKHVFMHDFAVCFYFFALIGSFTWSSYGYDWVMRDPSNCNPGGGLSFAANVGWAFFYVAVLYTLAWMCCGCCAKATTIKKPGYEEVEAEEEPTGELGQPLSSEP